MRFMSLEQKIRRRAVWRLMKSELRQGARDFRLFLLCLILGDAAIALIGILAAGIERAITEDARAFLGGDAEATLVNRRASKRELAFLEAHGRVSLVVTVRAMARHGQETTLIELKGVDPFYPLAGRAELASKTPLAQALALDEALAAEEALLLRLGVKPGDIVTIGDAKFTLREELRAEPDRGMGNPSFGPHALTSLASLEKSGLLAPGGLSYYHYRILLKPDETPEAFRKRALDAFPQGGWLVKTYQDHNRTVERLLGRLQTFLMLVGLSALSIGGVGILNGVGNWLRGHRATIASLKATGVAPSLIALSYIGILGVMTLLGIAVALLLGEVAARAVTPFLQPYFPLKHLWPREGRPMLTAALFGGMNVACFSLLSFSRALRARPSLLFRGLQTEEEAFPPASRRVKILLTFVIGLFAALLLATSRDLVIMSGFILVAGLAFLVFAGVAKLLARLPSGLLGGGAARFALIHLAQENRQHFALLPAIGIGLTALIALLTIEGNIERELTEELPAHAPSLFCIDIQAREKEAFLAALARTPGASGIESAPMARGRIVKVKGKSVEELTINESARWAIESDRGFSEAGPPPEGTEIVAGSWWGAGYQGPPLLSLDRTLAEGMGVGIGDTLTLNVTGRDITAKIVNLRIVHYANLRLNFALILSPGSLDGFYPSWIATVRLATLPQESDAVRALARRFPSVSLISVREVLAQAARIFGHIMLALHLASLVVIAASLMVLMGAMGLTMRLRAHSLTIACLFGASRAKIGLSFLIEWSLLALATGIAATALGQLGAWLLAAMPACHVRHSFVHRRVQLLPHRAEA
jgi:putative ABC transport system permease protein